MTGKAYISTFKYYDNRTHRMAFKNRPVLIVGQADNSDYADASDAAFLYKDS